MKCKDFERDIYLYNELDVSEKSSVDDHIRNCESCRELLVLVKNAEALISQTALIKPQPENFSRITSNIMQAIPEEQKQSASWINSLFIKYAMSAVSFALVMAFGFEQLAPVEAPHTYSPAAKTVTLTSASFSKNFRDRKEKSLVTPTTSLYACIKSVDCDNRFVENFKKKSL